MTSIMPQANYPEIVWPKTPTPLPGETPPAALKTLQTGGEPQDPVAGVPPQLIPREDQDIGDPGVPDFPIDSNGLPPQVPDSTTSVTHGALKKEVEKGWMRDQIEQFTKIGEMGTSFKKGILSSVPTAIAGVNADVQQVRIANTVGLGEVDMKNYKALAPLLRVALENPDEKAREASKARILASIPTLQGLPYGVTGTSMSFVEKAFSDPKFLDSMTERSKFKYTPFTDPILQVAIEMQENIDKNNPQDTSFVNSWADKVAGVGGSITSFLLARKAGGKVGLDAFAVYSGQGQLYEDALRAGATPEIAFKAATLGGFVGVTDVLPIERLVSSPKVTRALFALAISAGKQAMMEGFQEGFQQYMSNVIAKTLYRPDQDLNQQVWESAVLGAIGGVGADLATGGFREELKHTPNVPQDGNFTGPASTATPPAAAGPSAEPVQPNSPEAAPMAPATGEAAKPASPTLPEPMKVGLISKLPPGQRAIEADYVMAHDFSLVEPIQAEVAKGTPLSEISKVLDQQMGQVDAYLAKKGITAPADIFLERDALVRSVVAKLGIANQTSPSIAPEPKLVTIDSLPAETKSDITLALSRLPAFQNMTESDIRSMVFGLADPVMVPLASLPPSDIAPGERQTSEKAVANYAGMRAETAPPVLVDARNLVEGGHRHKAALQRKDATMPAVDIGELLRMDWKGFLDGETLPSDPVRSNRVDTSTSASLGVTDHGQASQTSDTGGEPAGRGSGAEAPLGEGERLPGLPPGSPGPNQGIVDAAKAYLDERGLPYRRQAFHVYADPERGKRIADAYEAMPHAPDDPEVKAAYAALIEETKAQYQAVLDMGLQIEMIQPGQANPYSEGPKQVFEDLAKNHLWFYPSASGFGTVNEITDNPLLTPTEFKVGEHVMLANDLFRVVHDVFGHGLEGAGFGPSGEENAFQAHVRMFSPLAARAMTSETRGQNSWVNYGPFGEANRANQKETVYADQKTGLMPEWTTIEGIVPDVPIRVMTKRLPDLFEAPEAAEQEVDPLTVSGPWRDAAVDATLEGGETVVIPAGSAIDFMQRRLKSFAELLECVNAN